MKPTEMQIGFIIMALFIIIAVIAIKRSGK